jgi:anti-sigma-K factor RskA
MIPENRDELHTLAGEYILGVLDMAEVSEIKTAMVTNAELRDAVVFWEEMLHPLSALALPIEPPPELWDRIAARLDGGAPTRPALRLWSTPGPWRWSTAGFAAIAAALALYIALKPVSPAPSFVAILHAPQHEQANWVAIGGRRGLLVRAAEGAIPPPSGRAFQLWAIAPGAAIPQSLGVIPLDGVFRLDALPPFVREGATLAVSIEPPGGSPTKQPTGPVVFVGALSEM